jgi:murein DD-endopeptidase MepM/ murein hydrolase activator NlpD
MDNRTPEDNYQPVQGEGAEPPQGHEPRTNFISKWVETLTNIGLGETLFRIGTTATFVILVLVVVWLLRTFYTTAKADGANNGAAAQPLPTLEVSLVAIPQAPLNEAFGIRREANLHTIIPDRPREDIIKYEVQSGDTIIGIAQKFGLNPKTILWGNYYILKDVPENLQPGQKLNILPVDGTYYQWNPGDGLNGVAKFFGVKPEDIINFPANNLSQESVGDFTNPNIKVGSWLIIPGGSRPFIAWSAPIGVTRSNPALARVLGPGSCGKITEGAIGTGAFIWPSSKHYISGYDYSPDTNHPAIDIAGTLGEPVWASDAGVIVYAGWNNWGYGNMIMVDHGNGWQTLYAHLSGINVVCGQSVEQGGVIGALGSTGNSSGPHLHFEIMNTSGGKVNPHDFLPPP